MKQRNFSYAGGQISKIEAQKNSDFILHLQKSMLFSLVQRKLITVSQMKCCMDEIERRISNQLQKSD